MSYADALTTANDPTFRGRVLLCAVTAAVAVAAEAPTDPPTVGRMRQELAYQVLGDPVAQTDRFVYAVLTNPTARSSGLATTDNDLEFIVASVWDALAGTYRAPIF